LALFTVAEAHAQGPTKTESEATRTFAGLIDYVGTYEYDGGFTVQIVVSPADTTLNALLGGAKYRLTSTPDADTFLNAGNKPVIFVRDDSGNISGFTEPVDKAGHIHRLLSEQVDAPSEMWFPRAEARSGEYAYEYTIPDELGDGLPVRSLYDSSLDPDRIREMIQRISDGEYPDVHSVLILAGGSLVLEEYFYEYDRAALHQLRSATKSFVSGLVGIAVDRGLIDGTGSRVLPYFADEYAAIDHLTDAKERITVGHLLTQRSGLACHDWDADSPGNEVKMGRAGDWVKFILDLPMVDEPGTAARYCSGGVKVLGRIVEKLAGTPLESFAEEHLFGPLGIEDYEWRFDPDPSSSETFTQMYLRPRDMAKFGLLFSNRGRWDGRQVISEEWVDASTSRHTTVGDTDYGYLWWRPYLNVPGGVHHAVAAQGNGGQEIYIWPDLDLVVVLTGGNYNRSSHTNELMIKYILPL
jgi:CubicO group peptidase (beta-lactamase class C family)